MNAEWAIEFCFLCRNLLEAQEQLEKAKEKVRPEVLMAKCRPSTAAMHSHTCYVQLNLTGRCLLQCSPETARMDDWQGKVFVCITKETLVLNLYFSVVPSNFSKKKHVKDLDSCIKTLTFLKPCNHDALLNMLLYCLCCKRLMLWTKNTRNFR